MAENGAQLTPQQQRAITALLNARNVREAAALSKVAERTLWRWLSDPDFIAGLRHAESSLLDAATRRLLTMQDGALDTLQGLLSGAVVDDGVKLRAALGILAHVLKLRELRDVEARLTALEEAHAASK
jgi:hypothetical protein